MLMLTYSGLGILAILILLIINFRALTSCQEDREKRAYNQFLLSLLLYFITDTFWGLLEAFNQTTLLKIDTVAYYFTLNMAILLCYRYVLVFLNMDNFISKNARSLSLAFVVLAIVLLTINWFTPIFFWYDEDGTYHTGDFRNIVLLVQVTWFALMSFLSLKASLKSTGISKARNNTIFLFGLTMTVSTIFQWIFPLLPLNTAGFCVGLLIIHVFIHEEDEQLQMKEIQALNEQMSAKNDELKALYHDKKWQEEKHRMELNKLKTMLESSNIGTWQLISEEGKRPRLVTDEKMKQLMGITDPNISDEDACEMLMSRIHPDDLPAFLEYDKMLKSGVHTEITYRWDHPVMGERYVRCGGIAVKGGQENECNGYHSDVTEQIKREKALKVSIEANKTKTRFLQNMSHEIRTPLNAMFGFSQLLGMPDGTWTDEEKEKYNTYIYNSYNMMDMLISDILDTADSDHGNYKLNIADVHVNSVCQFAMMAVEFRRLGTVEMKFTSEVEDSYTIKSDSRRIQQVLVNFLTNACKNTMEGSIHLHCSTTERPGRLTFSVTDTGKGVPPEKANEIFGRFTKLDQHVQGSGLGLNICHTIATKMNGEVYLDTSYTGGARFVFVI